MSYVPSAYHDKLYIKIKKRQNAERTTSGLASVGVYIRGKFCGNLKVLSPVRALAFPRPNAKPRARCMQTKESAKEITESDREVCVVWRVVLYNLNSQQIS